MGVLPGFDRAYLSSTLHHAEGGLLWPPSTFHVLRKDLGNGHFMVGFGEYNQDTRDFAFHLEMTCTNHLEGFTGGVKLDYFDNQHKHIGPPSAVNQFGLGSDLFHATHRNENWHEQAPPGTESISIALFPDPKNRIGELGDAIAKFIVDIGKIIADAAQATADWCNQNRQWCELPLVVFFAVGAAITGEKAEQIGQVGQMQAPGELGHP